MKIEIIADKATLLNEKLELQTKIKELESRLQKAAAFFHNVEKMRFFQKQFFKNHTYLKESKEMESIVDRTISECNSKNTPKQQSLNL